MVDDNTDGSIAPDSADWFPTIDKFAAVAVRYAARQVQTTGPARLAAIAAELRGGEYPQLADAIEATFS